MYSEARYFPELTMVWNFPQELVLSQQVLPYIPNLWTDLVMDCLVSLLVSSFQEEHSRFVLKASKGE